MRNKPEGGVPGRLESQSRTKNKSPDESRTKNKGPEAQNDI